MLDAWYSCILDDLLIPIFFLQVVSRFMRVQCVFAGGIVTVIASV